MGKVLNPILKGFNPDPSIVRVGSDYYIATSTFEWFPGVQIHHSKDLINWNLVSRPLQRLSQLDMRGVPDSCGVWAPCLSYHEGTFYLVYSNVKSFQGVWKDTPNYLVTTNDILGEWSEPTFMSAMGFDGSLFHDDDGKKWYTSILVDHRNNKFFGGIVLQEYDPKLKKLVGTPKHIFEGSELGITEGPHLYKKDGYYYLITAEGGTEYGHAVTIARSRNIEGPYELHPYNPLVTCRNNPDLQLQKSGHADLVQDEHGNWYTTFLVGRPLTKLGRCTLGRETAIEKITWKENEWPVLSNGSNEPQKEIELEGVQQTESKIWRDDFESETINIDWQSLRVPMEKNWVLQSNGKLTLFGRESLSSFNNQSLVARRVQHFNIEVTTFLEFEPTSFQQIAGLIFYYNTGHFHYAHISRVTGGEKHIQILSCDKFDFTEPLETPLKVLHDKGIYLKGTFNRDVIQYFYSEDGENWQKLGPQLDGSILSDDYVRDEENRYQPAFTGAFTGVCCQDLTGNLLPAHFHFFEYKILDDE